MRNLLIYLGFLSLQVISGHFIPHIPMADDEAMPWYIVKEDTSVCQTTGCVEAAEALKVSIDSAADPCNDFYAYACGGWQKRNPIPKTESQWNQFNIVDRKLDLQLKDIFEDDLHLEQEPEPVALVKQFFQACMDIERREQYGVRPLSEILSTLGGWPIATTEGQWSEDKFDLLKTLGFVTRRLGLTPLATVFVYTDRKNSSRSVVTVDQGSLVLPRAMLAQPSMYKKQLTAYAEWMVGTAKLLGARVDEDEMMEEAKKIVHFESRLAELTAPSEDRRDAYRMYNSLSVRQLQKWTDTIQTHGKKSILQWDRLLSLVFQDTEANISSGERMLVREMEYLLKLEALLQNTSRRTLANYILWRVVKSVGRDTSAPMRHLSFSFDKVFSGIVEDQPLWIECVTRSTSALPFAAGYQFVRKFFDSEAKITALEMVHHIRQSFIDRVDTLEWMDDETKLAAREKAEAMAEFIGFPDWFSNATALKHYYEGAIVGKDHFENVMALTSVQVKRVFDKLREATDRNDWLTGPAVVNAYYNPLTNAITFPAGILQAPFFGKDTLEALNYGSIGVIIGHEITHGFDDMGRQNDKDGNLVQWWTPETEYAYLEKALCIVEQYDHFRVPELDVLLATKATINGVTTQGENIADNGGMEQAFQAYQQFVKENGPEQKLPGLDYTPEQIFFLGFASVWCESSSPESLLHEVLSNPHAPHRHRVNGPLANSHHFAKTWQCKTGSPMNPVNKCQVW
ncbi:neprilysin-4-like [Neocloeon triangulifer]|uniref:neprilysin-4-like n=1 Tax=Neocloeon triangulifer TaxID=2078957 RepID=UPI00286F1EFB|nr:neprilysin-4-like [Neocloeon triangulifer]